MAQNPRHWVDVQGGGEEAEDGPNGEDHTAETAATEDMTHSELDRLAEAKGIELPEGLNKADKVAYINDPDNQVV